MYAMVKFVSESMSSANISTDFNMLTVNILLHMLTQDALLTDIVVKTRKSVTNYNINYVISFVS